MRITLNAFELMSHLQFAIGVGVTVHNRNEQAVHTIAQIKRFTSMHRLVIVDDGSAIPFDGATFRFEQRQGIPVAKNKCLELLEGCEYIFLFDDDTYPKLVGWESQYMESGQPHLCFTFHKLFNGATNGNRLLLGYHGKLAYYQNPCGCMMYFHRSAIDKIGGFDTSFKGYAYEHVNLSQRIHNAGLTKYPFMDLPNSLDLLHSMDYFRQSVSSLDPRLRMEYINHNRPIYEAKKGSKEWIAYK